jgi:triacylglycerol lipase
MGNALECSGGVRNANRHPVLLVHGTGTNAAENWGWNYRNALRERGYAVCTVNLPRRSMPDIQRQSEYVVFAVRRIAARSGGKVDVIGHSQGTLQPRWAIKWWRDVRRKVDDYVSLAGPHRGTVAANVACLPGFCAPSVWQMMRASRFLKALNRGDDTPGSGAFTSIYSATDELVQPASTAALDGAVNVLVQDVCPGRVVPHVGPLWDAVVFALVSDALTHRGPARVARLPGSICLEALYPGLTLLEIPPDFLDYTVQAWSDLSQRWPTTSEPRLAPYAR